MQSLSAISSPFCVMLVAAVFLLNALSCSGLADDAKIRPGIIIQFKTAIPAWSTREDLQEYLTY